MTMLTCGAVGRGAGVDVVAVVVTDDAAADGAAGVATNDPVAFAAMTDWYTCSVDGASRDVVGI